jgi:ubiquinone/menaquinone biosynthesis C-methylase UbiE
MPIFDHFSVIAPWYDRFIHFENVDRIASLLDLPVHGWLLDAGGGTGRIAQALTALASSIVIVDLSFGMVVQAAGKDGLKTVCSQTERLPFSDGSFERIIMVDAFHHVCDQIKTAKELWRVLKPGGRMVIEEPDIRSRSVKLVAVLERIALMQSHFLTPSRIEGLFTYGNSRTWIVAEDHTSWVIIEKVSP